jgi:hypothetical protein
MSTLNSVLAERKRDAVAADEHADDRA